MVSAKNVIVSCFRKHFNSDRKIDDILQEEREFLSKSDHIFSGDTQIVVRKIEQNLRISTKTRIIKNTSSVAEQIFRTHSK